MASNTIDCTPTWSSLLPSMLAVIENPKSNLNSRVVIKEELERMAKIADAYVKLKAEKVSG